MLVRVTGVNICPKKSETVSPNMGYSATVFPAQPVDLKTVISKFLNSLKSMCFNSFMNNELKETIVLAALSGQRKSGTLLKPVAMWPEGIVFFPFETETLGRFHSGASAQVKQL